MDRVPLLSEPKHSLPRRCADRVGAVFSIGESVADGIAHALHGSNEVGHPSPHAGPLRRRWGDLSHHAARICRSTEQAWYNKVTDRFPVR
jgi:hypothetical protein